MGRENKLDSIEDTYDILVKDVELLVNALNGFVNKYGVERINTYRK